MASVSFLAARAAPSGAFWLALTGGTALAREAETRGVRAGYAASAAAMLQTVAVFGPLRFSAPLTQALSAPLVGAMHARGRRPVVQFAACLAIRLANYAVVSAFTLLVLLGPKGYAGSYRALFGWVPFLPSGLAGALTLTAIVSVVSAVFYSAVQIGVYRRALNSWSGRAVEDTPRKSAELPDASRPSGADPRVALAAATVVSVALLVSHDWVVLASVAVWLALASLLARHQDRDVLRVGLSLAAVLAAGTFAASLLGGLAVEQAASRGVRGALLVLVATWLRMAAGSAGLSEAFRRILLRLKRLPSAREAGEILSELDSGRLLAASAKALPERLRGVGHRPAAVADAVLAWAAQEAHAFPVQAPVHATKLYFRARDGALTASLVLPSLVLAAVLA
ncbi:MAG: hypothetical protein QOD66_2160 [Solirubrobacteraceae bacterium]|nr:hypothetical protein [Solirubrobacteraceae bacterium]